MKKIILLSLAIFFVSITFSIPVIPQSSIVQKQKETNKNELDKLRTRISTLQKDLIEKNKKFRIDVLEITKYKISEITGLKKPVTLEADASSQAEMSPRQYKKFLSRLKELGLLDDYLKSLGNEETPDTAPVPDNKNEVINKPEPAKEQPVAPIPVTPVPKPSDKNASKPSADLSAFSWLAAGKLTPVKNQKLCGSCWTFTSAAVVESSAKIIYNEEIDIAEQSILDCSKLENGKKAGSCETGGWYGSVFSYYQKNAFVSENKNPYKASNSACINVKPSAYKVGAWAYLRPDAGTPDVKTIKKAIAEHGPIAACVKVTELFQSYSGGIFDEHTRVSGPSDVNHAITLVGWDDSKKAWLLRNSWGPEWGENGYMWIEYGCNNVGYGATWVAAEKEGVK